MRHPSWHAEAKVHRAVQYWHKGTSRRMDCLMGCTSFEHYRETVWIYSVPKACAHVKGYVSESALMKFARISKY
jgi:hypothetical protein